MLIFAVLLALVLIRWGALFVLGFLVLPRVRSCPACFDRTVAVRRPWLRRLAPWLEWRWCPGCGWQGLGSRRESELVPSPGRARRHAGGGTNLEVPGEAVPPLERTAKEVREPKAD